MRTVHVGPLTVLPGVAGLLAVLDATVGLGVPALVTAAVLTVALWLMLERGLRREGLARLGPANSVTLVRAALVVAVTALVVQSWSGDVPRSLLVALSSVALALDLVDGRLARARGIVTALGAAFDMETDAFLILVLSVYVVPVAGAWVLLIGLARYLLLLATAVWPWLGGPVPPRPWAKVVAAVQGVVLVVAAAEVLPTVWAQVLLAAALVLLLESFGRQVVTLWRHRHEQQVPRSPLVRPVLDAVAVTVVWLALVLPQRPEQLTAAALLGIPVELLGLPGARAGAAAGLGPGARRRRRRPAGRGGDRGRARPGLLRGVRPPLQPADRPGLPRLRAGPPPRLRGSRWTGRGPRRDRAAAGRRRRPVRVVGGAHPAYGPGRAAGLEPRRSPVWPSSGWSPASAARRSAASRSPARQTASLVAGQVDQVRAELHDRAVFDQAMTHDAYALTPGRDLLTRLRGKDVLAGLRRELRAGGRGGLVVRAADRPHADRGDRASRPSRLPRPQRLAGLADLRRDQLARPLHAAVRAVDRLPAALRPGARHRPLHPRLGVPEGRLAHRRRRTVQLARLARGPAVLPLPTDVRLLRRRLRRSPPRLRAGPRPVHAACLRRPRAAAAPAVR